MKNAIKRLEIAILTMVIGFSVIACPEPGDDPDNGGSPDGGKTPSAVVSGSPVTVTATKANTSGNGAAQANVTVTINLSNATVNGALSMNASAWFTQTVAGLTYNANAVTGANTITITITGIPMAVSTDNATINIPAGVIKDANGAATTATLTVSGNITYTIDEADPGALPTPAAAISGSVTVTATKANAIGDGALAANATVTINLTNATVNNALSATNADAWFTPSVAGLAYSANASAGANAITITIAGTPTAVSTADATISIPAGVIQDTEGTATTAALMASGNITYNIDEASPPPQPFNDISAAELVANIRIGWNLGNTLDAHNGESSPDFPSDVAGMERWWSNPNTTKAMITAIKNAGFNGIRIPVSWYKVASGPNYTIRSDWMERVVEVVNYAVDNDMYILLNTHHDEHIFKFTNVEKTASINAFTKIWEQIANTFKDYDERLIFEGLNEPRTIGSGDEWKGGTAEERAILNEYYQAFVDTVRASGGNNGKRILMVNTYAAAANLPEMQDLLIPNDPANTKNKIIVSIHAYSPYEFAHQYGTPDAVATWDVNNLADKGGVNYAIDNAYATFVSKGIPVIIGEFGSREEKAIVYREAWSEYYVAYAKSKGIPCFLWDDNGWFKLFDRNNLTFYAPSVLAALMNGLTITLPSDDLPIPNPSGGNMGNYHFGLGEDGVTPVYQQAVWSLSGSNLSLAKTSGTRLVLVLSQNPSAVMQLVWQGPANEIWWQSNDILGNTGSPNGTGATWDAGAKTLTINLADALADYGSFTAQPSLNIIIAYYGTANINDLGIVSANLVGN